MTLGSGQKALYENGPAPPLSWRIWLLVPLAALALLGLAVSLSRVSWSPENRDAVERGGQERMVPYQGELQRLLRREDLPPRTGALVRGLHDELTRKAEANGGLITVSDWRRARRFIEEWGR